jgi:hypothetical protein
VALWDGAWHALDIGMNATVRALCTSNDELIAGGDYTIAGGRARNRIAVLRPLSGACCFANGACAVMLSTACVALGGVPADFGTTCADVACPPCIGDMDCDGLIDFRDINRFVLYLSNFDAWQAAHPDCNPLNGDINGDGEYGQGSFRDINPFVTLLAQGAAACD